MQLNQTQFSSALAESSLFSYLESIVNKDPKTEQEVELIFGKQASNDNMNST